MSSRALKKLNKTNDLDLHNPDLVESDDELLIINSVSQKQKKKKKNRNKDSKSGDITDELTSLIIEEENFSSEENKEKIVPSISDEEVKEEKVKINPFALLQDDMLNISDNETDNISEEESKPIKYKSKNKKKKPKKKKPSNTTINNEENDQEISLKELDKILDEVNNKFQQRDDKKKLTEKASQANNEAEAQNKDLFKYKKLLSVENKNLDPLIETTRIFGSKIVKSLMKTNRAHRFGRTSLSTPKDTWPPSQKLGLSMDLPEIVDGLHYFKFTHSTKYREVQRAFYQAVASLDPNNIMALSHISPYHVDVLLQLSEIAKNSGQITEASEFIERALYSCEKSFHTSFSLSSGVSRLNFNQLENRSFFLALLRRLQFLSRQGCWRTSLEFSKALLSLSPTDDPLGALFYLDFFALKSQEYQYLIQFYEEWPDQEQIQYLPNFTYSVALAFYQLSIKEANNFSQIPIENSDAVTLLARAIILFPSVIVGLINKTNVAPGESFSKIRVHANLFQATVPTKDSQFTALSDLYIERAFSLWKEADVTQFIQSGVAAAAKILSKKQDTSISLSKNIWDADTTNDISYAVCRHLIVSDIPELAKHIPKEIRNQAMYMHDPVPPPESVSLYDDFRQLPGYGQGNRGEAFGSNLAGSFASALETLRVLFRNNPNGQNEDNDQDAPEEGQDRSQLSAQSLLRMITNILPSSFSEQAEDGENGDFVDDGATTESYSDSE